MLKKNNLTSVFLLIVLLLFFSCSSHKVDQPVKKEATAETKIAIAPEEILQNLDFKFSQDLNKIWETFFKEVFTDTRSIDLFIATNRKMKNGMMGCSNDQLGVEGDNLLKLGLCRINVPKNHTTGEINFTKDNRQSSHDYFKVIGYKNFTEEKFFESLKKSRRIPLVFVHGFNVRYQEAVLRAAQIAYDLKYQGPVVLFSWPAGAGDGFLDEKLINVTYKNNTKTAADSIVYFKNFLSSFKKADIKINLMVHSMGHQVVIPALNDWVKENSQQLNPENKLINELILNAPDFESDKFVEYAESLNALTKRITLYCSFNDNAMVASEVFNKTKRLGACTQVENVDSINVSQVDAPTLGIGGLGHGYYSSRPILSDVFQVLLGLDAEKRLFIRKSEPNSTEKYFLRP